MQLVQSGQGTLGGTVQQGGAFKATREQIQESQLRGARLRAGGFVGQSRLGAAGMAGVYHRQH